MSIAGSTSSLSPTRLLNLSNHTPASEVCSPQSEYLAVGIFYEVISIFFLAIYFPTLYLMMRNKEIIKRPVYKLLVWSGVAQIILVFGVGVAAGVFTITNQICSAMCMRTVGSVTNMAWYSFTWIDLFVCINRLLAMCSPSRHAQLFEGRKAYYWVAASWMLAICWNALYLSRSQGLVYDKDSYAWQYIEWPDAPSHPPTVVLETIENYTKESLMFLISVVIAAELLRRHKKGTSHQLSKTERYAIYQMLLVCTGPAVMNMFAVVAPQISASKWIAFVGNTLSIVVAGWTPLIFFAFNKTLRDKVFGFPFPQQAPSMRLASLQAVRVSPAETGRNSARINVDF